MGTAVPIFIPPSCSYRNAMTAPVSVIIPTYNRCELLPRAIDSVLAQSLPAREICVVDDGSSDDTRQLMASRYPEIDYIYQDNRGVSAARNLGVMNSAAPWLAFLDSDDAWLAHKLETQMAAIEAAPGAELVHCDEIWMRRGRRVNAVARYRKRGGDIFSQCLQLCAMAPSAVLLRRSRFDQLGGFDETLPACEDYDLWLRYCSRDEVVYIDEPLLTRYAGHADQLSMRHWGMDRFRVQALAKLLAAGHLDDQQRAQTQRTLREKCAVLINGARKRGNQELIATCETLLDKAGVDFAS